MQTVPTGVSGLPPEGPATPVTATATSAPLTASAPEAIAEAVSRLTTPYRSIVSCDTPRSRTFASIEYDTTPPQYASEDPGTAVKEAPISPPVKDSAVTSVRSRALSADRTVAGRCGAVIDNAAPIVFLSVLIDPDLVF